MTRNQRVGLLAVAALIAIVAFVALRPADEPDDAGTTATQAAQPETAPTSAETQAETATETTPATTPKPKPKPKPPLLRAGRERTLTFEQGDTIRFRVRHTSPEEVHVHGYDRSRDLPAGKTVTMSFKATIEGIFEVELEHSGTPLGNLKVEP